MWECKPDQVTAGWPGAVVGQKGSPTSNDKHPQPVPRRTSVVRRTAAFVATPPFRPMTSPVESSTAGVEAVVVRTLVELACAVVRREGLTPGVDYYHPSPATLAAPQLTALLQALATLARVGPAWREAFDVPWLSRALSLALSRDPPAWRGWTLGLASAAAVAYSLPLKLSP